MIRHIVFDLDGTLVDSAAVCIGLAEDMLGERGCARTIDPAFARRHMSLGGTQLIAALLGAECGDPDVEIADFRRRYADRPTPPHSLFDGVREGLTRLRDLGFGLAICSNKPQFLCEKVLIDLDLAHLFDVVVGGAPGRRAKPERDLLDLTLAALATTADTCLYVGDSELDGAVAAAGGIPVLFATYGYCEPEWDAGDAICFDHFADAVSIIAALRPGGMPLPRTSPSMPAVQWR